VPECHHQASSVSQRRPAVVLHMTELLPRMYTLKEVAELTGFALRTLQLEARAGKFTHIHRGRTRLMTMEQIQVLVSQSTKASAAVSEDTARASETAAGIEYLRRSLQQRA